MEWTLKNIILIMSSTKLFRKHFGEESVSVDLKHKNMEAFFEDLNKECLEEDGRTWCVKEHLFFSVTQPKVAENLTEEEAKQICKEWNDKNDDMYVNYFVHNCA